MVNPCRKFGAEPDQIAHVVRVSAEDVIYLLFCEFEEVFVIDGAGVAMEVVVGAAEVVGVDGEEKRRRSDVLHVVPLADE